MRENHLRHAGGYSSGRNPNAGDRHGEGGRSAEECVRGSTGGTVLRENRDELRTAELQCRFRMRVLNATRGDGREQAAPGQPNETPKVHHEEADTKYDNPYKTIYTGKTPEAEGEAVLLRGARLETVPSQPEGADPQAGMPGRVRTGRRGAVSATE